MAVVNKNQEKQPDSVPSATYDDFEYEEVSLEDEWSLTEGEEDLEATVKAIQDRAWASARAFQGPDATYSTQPPLSVLNFLRNFLFQTGMTGTLDCFETEWTEIVQKGLAVEQRVDVVPNVYIANQRLERELKNARRDREEYRQAACAAAEALARVQRARDVHRLHHKRVVQEKKRLIEEMKKLKSQCDSYEPAVKRVNEKYQTVLKQVMMLALDTDKALLQVNRQSEQRDTVICGGEEVGETRIGQTAHPVTVTQPRPPAYTGRPGRQPRVRSVKANVP